MELTALLKALEEVKLRWPELNVLVTVFSDSLYAVEGSNKWMFNWEKNGWKKSNALGSSSAIANLDLWKILFELVNEIKPTIKWIKGHAGDKYNELCDNLATFAIKRKDGFYRLIRNAKGPTGN
jgi:ribonuclease HI